MIEADVEAVMAEYAAGVLAKDPARVAALYAPEVRVFDTWGVWSHENRDAWAGSLHRWLGSLGDEVVQVRFDEARLERHGQSAWLSAFVRYSAVDPAGNVIRWMQNRLSWFLTKTAGRWAIAHEHTSTPIGFEDQKAILRRD